MVQSRWFEAPLGKPVTGKRKWSKWIPFSNQGLKQRKERHRFHLSHVLPPLDYEKPLAFLLYYVLGYIFTCLVSSVVEAHD